VDDLLIEIDLAKEEASSVKAFLEELGVSYSVVETAGRVRLVLTGRQAVALAAVYAKIVDKVEGEVLELVYLAGSLIVEELRKYAVLRLKTPREAEEAASRLSGVTKAAVRGRYVVAGGDFLTRLLDLALNFRQLRRGAVREVKRFVEQIYDPGRRAVYIPRRLYTQFAEHFLPQFVGDQMRLPGGWLQVAIGNGMVPGWDAMPPDFMEALEMRHVGTYRAEIGDAVTEVKVYALGDYWKVAVVSGVDAETLRNYLGLEGWIPQQDGKLYLSRWATAELLKSGLLQ